MIESPAAHGPGSTPLRVLFDHQIFLMQRHGGISRYFAALARHLPHYGVDPGIAAPVHINAYLGALPRSVGAGIRIEQGRWRQALARRMSAPLVAARVRRERPDVVHETYFSSAPSARGVALALTVYDMIHELIPSGIKGDRTVELKRAAIARADTLLCISESTRRDLVRIYPETEDRAHVTLLGFDPHPLVAKAERTERPYCLYVGPRGGYKNFALLCEALSITPTLDDLDLVCVGGGEWTAQERDMVSGRGLADRIRRQDADDQALQHLYRNAAAFAYPSSYEGFGIPPLEAMAQQCPVVCFAVASMPEVCGDAAAYPDGIDARALGETIARVVNDRTFARELRSRGSARLERFSWDSCAAQTAAIYRTMT